MKKKLLSLALCLCMVLSLLPSFALADDASYITVGGITIGGEGALPTGVSCAGGVLTLNGATINSFDTIENAGIYANDDLTINLVGENSIVSEGDSGIKVSGSLTFTGTGSLEIKVTKAGAVGIGVNPYCSIETQAGATVTVSQAAYGVQPNDFNSNEKVLTLSGSGHLSASGSTYGISAAGIQIDGAHVTAEGIEESGKAFSFAPVFSWDNTIPQTYFNMGVKAGDNSESATTIRKPWKDNIDYTTSKYVDINLYNLVLGELKKDNTVNVSEDYTAANEPAIAWLGDSLTINVTGQSTITSTFTNLEDSFNGFKAAIYAPNSAVIVEGSGTLTAISNAYDVVTKKDSFTGYDKLNGMVFFSEGNAHKGTVSGKCNYQQSLNGAYGIGTPPTTAPYNVLTVPENATLVVPEAKEMLISSVDDNGIKAVSNSGTLENNGIIALPKYEYGDDWHDHGTDTSIDKLTDYLGTLTGTGYITLNHKKYTNSGIEFDDTIPATGLDLSTGTPTAKTVYKAGSGFATWEPTLSAENAVTGGTLTLADASISSTGSAVSLPAVPVTVGLTGANTLSSGDSASDITSEGAVTLASGTFGSDVKVTAGAVTLGNITIPADKTLDLSAATAVTKGTAGAVNSGTLKLPAAADPNALSITGSGSVMVGDNTMTKLNGEWVADGGAVSDGGLDLNFAPTVKTLYTAGTGKIIWEPTETGSGMPGGKLTLSGAKITLNEAALSAITLPTGVPVTVELVGTSTITSSAQQPGYNVFVGTRDVTLTGTGSIIAKTSGYFIKTDGAVTLKGGSPTGRIYAPGGVTLDGVTFTSLNLSEVTGGISATGTVNNGTLTLPDAADAAAAAATVKALGLTGTGLVMIDVGTSPDNKTLYYRNDGTVFPYRTTALDLTSSDHSNATLAADGYTFTGDATDGYVLTLGDLVITPEATYTAIKLPTDGKVEVKLTGNTRVSTGGKGMEFGSTGTISGSGSLTLNCGDVALASSQPLTITGGSITASGGTKAFSTAPTFTGYTPKVTYGESALSTTSTTSPADTIYTGNKYVKIERYVAPSSGGGGGGGAAAPAAPTVEAPKTDGSTTTVTAEVAPTVSGTTETASIPAETVTKAVEAAVEAAKTGDTEAVVEISVKPVSEATTKVETTLPAAAVSKIAESKAALNVTTGVAEVALPAETVASIAEKADGKELSLSVETVKPESLTKAQKSVLGESAKDAVIIDLNLKAGDAKISDLGGSVTVSVPVTLSEGQKPENLKVWFIADDGTITPCEGSYDPVTKKFSFKTNHFSAYALVEFPFADVPNSEWYYGNVAYAYMNKLFSGTSDTTFEPETAMSRAMLVTVLWRMEGKPAVDYLMPFTDVDGSGWYGEAVRWAASEKLVNGVSATEFAPNAMISREQLATIMYNYAVYKKLDVTVGENTNILSYTDAENVSEYAVSAMQWACGAGLINGADGALMPQGSATRAQVAAILHRFCNAFVK